MASNLKDTFYCISCERVHSREEMRLIMAKGGRKRWTCIYRIKAEKNTQESRDSYGKYVTERNKALSIEFAKLNLTERLCKK